LESQVKLAGHPVHPMLVVFPLGLLSTAVVFDVVYALIGNRDLSTFSFWALIAGITGGLVAAVFGLIDWMAIPAGTRAKKIGVFHGIGNLVVVGLFSVSLWTRLATPAYLPNLVPLVVGLLGAGLALVTAWLGGELVFRLRIGVDDDAGLDASNSLSRDGAVEVRAKNA
jgi:uncharacterized membrane protein